VLDIHGVSKEWIRTIVWIYCNDSIGRLCRMELIPKHVCASVIAWCSIRNTQPIRPWGATRSIWNSETWNII